MFGWKFGIEWGWMGSCGSSGPLYTLFGLMIVPSTTDVSGWLAQAPSELVAVPVHWPFCVLLTGLRMLLK